MSREIIGFWGYPNPQVIEETKLEYPNAEWIDLDIDFNYPDYKILPESYCKIIKNIISNSLFYKNELEVIIAPIGKDKCDSGWFASALLKDLGFNVVDDLNQKRYADPAEKEIFDKIIKEDNLYMDFKRGN